MILVDYADLTKTNEINWRKKDTNLRRRMKAFVHWLKSTKCLYGQLLRPIAVVLMRKLSQWRQFLRLLTSVLLLILFFRCLELLRTNKQTKVAFLLQKTEMVLMVWCFLALSIGLTLQSRSSTKKKKADGMQSTGDALSYLKNKYSELQSK